MLYKLAIEIDLDDTGYFAVLVEPDGDTVLRVTDTYPTWDDAMRAAREWIDQKIFSFGG